MVRACAATALGDMGATRAVDALIEVTVHDSEWWVKAWAAEALGKIGASRSTQALTSLLEAEPFRLRASAAIALGRIGDPGSLPEFEAFVSRTPMWRRRPFRKALRELRARQRSEA
jgi:serine/threonine-protein kinase